MGGQAWLDDSVPDRSRLLSLSFGRVFVCDVGPGAHASTRPPLLLVHGLFMTHHVFSAIIPALARERRVIAIDLPGCGDSDHPSLATTQSYAIEWLVRALADVAEQLELDPFDILGHDFGGTLALGLASELQGRIRKLAVVSPLALTVSLPLRGALKITPALGLEVFRRAFRRSDLRRFLAQGMSTPELLNPSDLAVFWDRLGRTGGLTAAWAMLMALGAVTRMRDRFAAVASSSLVVWGDRDALVPPEQAFRLREILPSAKAALVDGCGHNVPLERPDALVALLEQHLAR